MKKFCQITLIVIAISPVAGCDIFGSALSPDVVKLDTTLGDESPGIEEGKTIELQSIIGGEVFDPFLPDCSCQHLHAVDLAGITIRFTMFSMEIGPFPDPDVEGCGYGCIGILDDLGDIFTPNEPVP